MRNEGHIAAMLDRQKKHISFHTPGHKRAGADITELSYSDNLTDPSGAIRRAEEDTARILHADRSYLLTDGSTAGIYSMIYALKAAGKVRLAVPAYCHASVKNACRVTGVQAAEYATRRKNGIPLQPSAEELADALQNADALLMTSPDYYGFFAPLQAARALCTAVNKPLLIDGAHGAHLHFTDMHAGFYADMWVDGAHKSLPALTQGAGVSAKGAWAQLLGEAVRLFRTSSPSYPIMASVERAVKYPRNEAIERAAEAFKRELCAVPNDDWSKLLIAFGENCDLAQAYLESKGVYPEFNDGNYLMFYLSPCTKRAHLKKLAALLRKIPRGSVEDEAALTGERGQTRTWLPLNEAVGRVCASECGLFPPCVPLLRSGDRVTQRAAALLSKGGAFGLQNGMICVYAEE